MTASRTPHVLVAPQKPALISGVAQKLNVLIRVQAPDPDLSQKTARKPYRLALVLDRSGSMSGEPLYEAIQCAKYIVDRLEPTDVASLTIFDDRVQTLAPAAPVGNRNALHAALERIHSGGSTNLHGGWKTGAATLLDQPGESGASALSRVILLSDGQANVGETTETETIAGLCAEAAERGVSTSTYGLGRNFNEELMVEMAKRGGGNHYYGDTAADLFEPFAAEFDLIAMLYARQVQLRLTTPTGVKLRVLNDLQSHTLGTTTVVPLRDIAWGAEAWIVAELEIDTALCTGKIDDGGLPLVEVAVACRSLDEQALEFPTVTLSLPALSAQAWDAVLADPLVASRLQEVEAGQLLAKARSVARDGDWEAIERLLAEARDRYRDHPWVLEMLENLAAHARRRDTARFSKESLYSSGALGTRLASKDEDLLSLACEDSVPSFLRRKAEQGKAKFRKRGDDSTR